MRTTKVREEERNEKKFLGCCVFVFFSASRRDAKQSRLKTECLKKMSENESKEN